MPLTRFRVLVATYTGVASFAYLATESTGAWWTAILGAAALVATFLGD